MTIAVLVGYVYSYILCNPFDPSMVEIVRIIAREASTRSLLDRNLDCIRDVHDTIRCDCEAGNICVVECATCTASVCYEVVSGSKGLLDA